MRHTILTLNQTVILNAVLNENYYTLGYLTFTILFFESTKTCSGV